MVISRLIEHKVIVVGASAGGVEALQKVVATLPADLPAAVFITLHLFRRSESVLPKILNAAGPLSAVSASDGMPITPGNIYVAPPDYHLLLANGKIHLGHGPKENMQRPCINTMFRSAASEYGECVIGVVLTGLLDDGAAGLWEIKRHGGIAIVQDPKEAAYPSMPTNAVNSVQVDFVLRLVEIGPTLTSLANEERTPHDLAIAKVNGVQRTDYTCPECGGGMVEAYLGDRLREYRCHTGHRFGLRSMLAEQTAKQERAIWAALAQIEEGARILEVALSDSPGASELAAEVEERRKEAVILRDLLERRRTVS